LPSPCFSILALAPMLLADRSAMEAKKLIPKDIRKATNYTATFLHHSDPHVRFHAVRALRFAKPTLTVRELQQHDEGRTFERLEELQAADSEAERLCFLAAELVEYVLSDELRPGDGEGYKAHVAEVQRGPGRYGDVAAEPADGVPKHGEILLSEIARRNAASAAATAASRKRACEETATVTKVPRGRTLTGHRHGICRACGAKVRLCDDLTSRKHSPGGGDCRKGVDPCVGSNELVAQALEGEA